MMIKIITVITVRNNNNTIEGPIGPIIVSTIYDKTRKGETGYVLQDRREDRKMHSQEF